MKKKSTVIAVITLSAIFCLTGLSFAEEKDTLKITHRVVTHRDEEGLKPLNLTSAPGTTVVWVNNSRFPIEILFLDKRVVLACGSPVNFFVGKDGAYESNKIPSGGTASLCFVEEGKYEYKVKPSSTTFYTGRIQRGFQGTVSIKE
jgi:plastocyanin